MKIRAAVVDDAEARVDRWRANIETGPISNLVVEADEPGRLLGFASSGPARDGDLGLPPLELSALYVRSERYGTGLGHALLEAAIGSSAAYLWVLEGNQRATAFYERQGFRFDGETKAELVGIERRMVRD